MDGLIDLWICVPMANNFQVDKHEAEALTLAFYFSPAPSVRLSVRSFFFFFFFLSQDELLLYYFTYLLYERVNLS